MIYLFNKLKGKTNYDLQYQCKNSFRCTDCSLNV